MASGQKLLADLLGITNSATESIWSSKLLEEMQKARDKTNTSSNDKKLSVASNRNHDINKSDGFKGQLDASSKLNKKWDTNKIDDVSNEDLSSASMHSASLDDLFDRSRCIEVKVPMNMLKEKQNSSGSLEKSQTEVSSSSSSERLPTPDPSDFVKSGVFVSSGQNAMNVVSSQQTNSEAAQELRHSSAEMHQMQQENIAHEPNVEQDKQWQQEQIRQQQRPEELRGQYLSHLKQERLGGSSGLMQGKENSNMTKLDTPERESEDVVVLRYPQGQKKNIIQEKFRERMQNSVPVKKVAIPKLVKLHDANSARDKDEPNPKGKDIQPITTSASANEAVSCAGVATSAAIAPFLQIQNALENQISSLVNTMNQAHTAKEQFKANSQEHDFKDLEKKILEILDRRLQSSDVQSADKCIAGINKAEKKTENPSLVPYKRDDKYQINQAGITNFDNELQLIPTREYVHIQRASSPLSKPNPPSTHIGPLPEPRLWNYSHIKPLSQPEMRVPPRSYPVPTKYFDKSTSPDSIRYLANAKTQTSSSESSLVSEKSLLETPLPRSKIPVPFSRYTPKRVASDQHSERIGNRPSTNGTSLLKKILKESKRGELSGKENLPPRPSSPKQRETKTRFVEDKSFGNKNAKDGKEIVKEEISDKRVGKENGSVEETKIIAPIDRYLVYPLRGQVPNLQNNPKTTPLQVPLTQEHTTQLAIPHEMQQDRAQQLKHEGRTMENSRGHYIAASRILSEIQQRRERLESNLGTIVRQREEERLYEYLDQHESLQSDEITRIRRGVDTKIQEISSQLKKEMQAAPKDFELKHQSEESKKKDSKNQQTKDFLKGKKEKFAEVSQNKRTRLKKPMEKKEKQKKKTKAKSEPSMATQPSNAQKPPQHNPALLASLISQQLHKPHRTTIRPSYIQFHSPSKATPKSERPTNQPSQQGETPDFDPPSRMDAKQPKYYFQPMDPQFPEPSEIHLYPARGELVPVARALGRPRQDERFRLPIPSEGAASSIPHNDGENLSRDQVTKSNVAFVEIKTDLSDKEDQKKKVNLGVQTLPSVDIHSNLEISKEEEYEDQKTPVKHITVTPPKPEDYRDFQNYIACDDVVENSKDIDADSADEALEFQGLEDNEPREYNEPRFPPQHPRYEAEPQRVEIKYPSSVEQRTQEWLEQELLARIVAQMNIPQDPTIITQQSMVVGSDESDVSDAEEDEADNDWIHEILGAAGVQLCIDAGIPLNKDLIAEIVKDVVIEKVKSLLGHPKQPQTPLKKHLSENDDDSCGGPQNVLTPMPTPDYTPLASEASAVHTPLSTSTLTEKSISQERSLQVDEELHEKYREEEDLNATDKPSDFMKVPTPPQTPEISETPMPVNGSIETPVSSVREEVKETNDRSPVSTPDVSAVAKSVKTLEDFVSTSPDVTESLPEATPPQSRESSEKAPAATQSPLVLPAVQVARKPPSTHSSSFTISSSTTVGTSMFEGISEGEKLCPDYIIPGLYSEGEFPLSEGQAVFSQLEGLEEDEKAYQKQLLKNFMGTKNQTEYEIDRASATLKDTEDLDVDTLEEVSISEGEFLIQEDPIAKLLNQIRTPPNDGTKTDLMTETDKSEGEISKGEDIKKNDAPDVMLRAKRNKGGFPRRILSVGEFVDNQRNSGKNNSNNTSMSHIPSLSVGEVRVLPGDGRDLSSDKKRVATSTLLVAGRSENNVKSDEFPNESTQLELESESLTEQKTLENDDSNLDDSENAYERGPNTILVQSGNFGTASTFNFTDSLNEPRGDVLREQRLDEVTDEGSLIEKQNELSVNIAEDGLQRKLSADKQPTKIMLMIPSVADEDSTDDVSLEGDEAYSNDDVSNISL